MKECETLIDFLIRKHFQEETQEGSHGPRKFTLFKNRITIWKCTIEWLSIHTQCGAAITSIKSQNISTLPKETLPPWSSLSRLLLRIPLSVTLHVLSIWSIELSRDEYYHIHLGFSKESECFAMSFVYNSYFNYGKLKYAKDLIGPQNMVSFCRKLAYVVQLL